MSEKILELITQTSADTFRSMMVILAISCAIAAFIFLVYRATTKSAFYSLGMNITIALVCIITTSIIIAMRSSLVISLGMVGALSIVRFRTAIKDPMDLTFLFWSIGEGIICGSKLYGLAIVVCFIMTLAIFFLQKLALRKAPYILLINDPSGEAEGAVLSAVKEYAKTYQVKSRNYMKSGLDMVVELRTERSGELLTKLRAMEALSSVSLLSHDGATRY